MAIIHVFDLESESFQETQHLTETEVKQVQGGDNPNMGPYSPGDVAGSTNFYSNSNSNFYSFTSDGCGNASFTTYSTDGSSTTIFY